MRASERLSRLSSRGSLGALKPPSKVTSLCSNFGLTLQIFAASPIVDSDGRAWWEEAFGTTVSKVCHLPLSSSRLLLIKALQVAWHDFATKLEAKGSNPGEKAVVWQVKDLMCCTRTLACLSCVCTIVV